MWTDAVDLRDFYATSMGRVAGRLIGQAIREVWPDLRGRSVLGLGYPTPFLGPWRGQAARVVAAMPAAQGVLRWPAEGGSLTTLVDEAELPFPDLSIDRVLLVHAAECSEQFRPMMREVWRVLNDSGRVLVVAPNRRGLWARFERSPFGHGHPYSAGQMSRALRDALFTPMAAGSALFVPPLRSRLVLSSARAWEGLGRRWFPGLGGVVLVEAAKQIYAGTPVAEPKRERAYLPLPSRKTPSANRSIATAGDGSGFREPAARDGGPAAEGTRRHSGSGFRPDGLSG